MKQHSTFANVVVIAIVAAAWCAASTVYHAHLLDTRFVYLSTPLMGSEVIAAVWTAWSLAVVVALFVGHVLSTVARNERQLQAGYQLYC